MQFPSSSWKPRADSVYPVLSISKPHRHIHFFKINYLDERNAFLFQSHWFELVRGDHIKEMWNLAWKRTAHGSNYIQKNQRNVIHTKTWTRSLINHIAAVIWVTSSYTLIGFWDGQNPLMLFTPWCPCLGEDSFLTQTLPATWNCSSINVLTLDSQNLVSS